MAKPATVEKETFTRKPSDEDRRLHLVENVDWSKDEEKKSSKARRRKTEAADDVDDMWDNVPV